MTHPFHPLPQARGKRVPYTAEIVARQACKRLSATMDGWILWVEKAHSVYVIAGRESARPGMGPHYYCHPE